VAILKDKRNEMAKALANGISKYIGVNKTQTVPFNLMGRVVQIEGQITDGTTFVAARQLLEALGYKVDWIQEKQTVSVRK
jgi:hypothetical protein